MMCPDNYSEYIKHENEQENALALLPVCSICDEPIQDDHLFDINDELICAGCMIEHFRKDASDYVS